MLLPLGCALLLAACSGSDSNDGAAGSSGAGAPNAGGTGGASGSTGNSGTLGGGGLLGAAGSAALGGAGASNAGAGNAGAGNAGAGAGGAASGGASGGGEAGGSSGHGGAGGQGVAGQGGTSQGGAAGGSSVTGPCDLYDAGNTPCVAAHSTVRALYGAFNGSLYQVRRASDKTTKDIGVLAPGGFANAATQDAFCANTTCTISIIYDQSPKKNHLTSAPAGGAKNTPDNEANATALKLSVGGHSVYGVFIATGIGYRIDKTSGIATGDQPETEYMVTSGKRFNGGCCFDYGNAETNNLDDGAGTMEAVYFGNSTGWGKGAGTGPWVMADLENGLFAGQSFAANPKATSVTFDYVTALVKGRSGSFALKVGNAQSGTLAVPYDGARPNGYNPMKKQGAIILGIGGDNSNSAIGNFFEGCMTSGNPSDETDSAVQANIVAAGYGK